MDELVELCVELSGGALVVLRRELGAWECRTMLARTRQGFAVVVPDPRIAEQCFRVVADTVRKVELEQRTGLVIQ